MKNLIKRIVPQKYHDGLARSARRIFYFGFKHYCPVCRSKVRFLRITGLDLPVIRKMKIIGAGKRAAICPVCRSSDRVRLIYLYLRDHTRVFKRPCKILHVAPERALSRIFRNLRYMQYHPADLHPEEDMEKMDITGIPYPEDTFDLILCNHVLEHIPDDLQAMKELFRVLKPDGLAVIQVPLSPVLTSTYEDPEVTREEDRERTFGQKDHVRIYGMDYPDRLSNAGFRVIEYRWNEEGGHDYPGKLFGLNEEEILFLGKKT